jgi:hypothetical protein
MKKKPDDRFLLLSPVLRQVFIVGQGALFAWAKWPGREAYIAPPLKAEVKNAGTLLLLLFPRKGKLYIYFVRLFSNFGI